MKLNKAQREAAIGSLTTDNFYLIHGPPGTGKSQTLTVILEALAQQKKRVLVCAEANNPVDTLLMKFMETDTFFSCFDPWRYRLVRTGNNENIPSEVHHYKLDNVVDRLAEKRNVRLNPKTR